METLKELLTNLYRFDELIHWGGYAVLVAVVFAETGLLAGFFLPGDSLLVTAGLLASGEGPLRIGPLILWLGLAAIAGDSVGYGIGVRTGPKIFTREDSLFFSRKHLISAREFYNRHGGFTIFIARFMPIIRTFAPVVAGVGVMQYRKFIAYNVFGGIFWVLTTTLAGYYLGKAIPNIQERIHVVIAIVIFLSLLPGVIRFASEKWKARK